jgi:GNAT superfamily N-acetyltransferase
MANEIFFRHPEFLGTIYFDEAKLGLVADEITPFTISITHTNPAAPQRDAGRAVGYEGEAKKIIGMHGLKPDDTAARGFEMTVFRVSEELRERGLHAEAFAALERWLLRRGWRGNIVKRLKYQDAILVIPIRSFWYELGFELVPWSPQWDEHVVKKWR